MSEQCARPQFPLNTTTLLQAPGLTTRNTRKGVYRIKCCLVLDYSLILYTKYSESLQLLYFLILHGKVPYSFKVGVSTDGSTSGKAQLLQCRNLTHWGRGHLNCLNARSRGLFNLNQLLYCVSLNIYNKFANYEGWNFNSGNYLFTTDTK